MVEGGTKIKFLFHFCEFSERRPWEMPQNIFLFSFCSFPERRARETSNNKSLALAKIVCYCINHPKSCLPVLKIFYWHFPVFL
jgi:hypothetical protein